MKKIKFAILVLFNTNLIFSVNTYGAESISKCPNELMKNSDLQDPESLKNYLNRQKINSLEKFVCCLPEVYRENYIVGMLSTAAQNGTPDSPRVIMSDIDDKTPFNSPPRFMFSFNGGKEHNSQGKSIEFAFHNPKTNELEFHDLDFTETEDSIRKNTQNFKHSKNSTTCMHCHGEAGRIPPGGPKYIFDSFSFWPRFVGGIDSCNEIESKIHIKAGDKALQTIKDDARYKCLNMATLKIDSKETSPARRYRILSSNLARFDNHNLDLNGNRSAERLRAVKNYDKFKYFLFAEQICGAKVSDWFPEGLEKSLLQNVSIHPDLTKSGDLKENFKTAVDTQIKSKKLVDEIQLDRLKDTASLFQNGYLPNYTSQVCRNNNSNPYLLLDVLNIVGISDEDVKKKNSNILLRMDRELRSDRMGQTLPHDGVRLFIEGQGEQLGIIATTMALGTPYLIRATASVHIHKETNDSAFQDLFEEISLKDFNRLSPISFSGSNAPLLVEENDTQKQYFYKSKKSKAETCQALKKISTQSLESLVYKEVPQPVKINSTAR